MSEYGIADEVVFFEFNQSSFIKKRKALWQLRLLLASKRIRKAIFNTASSNTIRNFFSLPLNPRVKFYGTLHNIQKLKSSFSQKIISTHIKKYFLLNDYLLDLVRDIPTGDLQFETYYPIYFPRFKDAPVVKKEPGELWICVPGQLEYKRREYKVLADTLATLVNKLPIKFLLLGESDHPMGDGPDFRKYISDLGVSDYFIISNKYMENASFHEYIKHSDIIMPLIHPGIHHFELYMHNMVSGAFNLAFASRKPLFLHHAFDKYEDFIENAIFYDNSNLGSQIQNIEKLIADKAVSLYKAEKWRLQFQAAKYLAFLK